MKKKAKGEMDAEVLVSKNLQLFAEVPGKKEIETGRHFSKLGCNLCSCPLRSNLKK